MNTTIQCFCFLMRDSFAVTENLGCRGNERDQVGELSTELLNA